MNWAGLAAASLLVASGYAVANDTNSEESATVVSQGKASLTLTEIDARISRIPADKRAGFMNDPDRIETLLHNMLTNEQLARQAEELGIEKDPVVAADIVLARDEILAKRRISMLTRDIETPNFDVLAHERYVTSPNRYRSVETVDIRHVLLSVTKHGIERARALAEEVHAKASAPGADFVALVKQYSDEKIAQTEGGLIQELRRGDTGREFENAAFGLEQPGDVSDIAQTKFGFHIIRLEKRNPSTRYPFESVKAQIAKELESEFYARAREDALATIRSGKLEADPDLVLSLRSRYLPGGPGVAAIEKSYGTHDDVATGDAVPASTEISETR